MTRVGVLSDSHIPSSTRRLPVQVLRAFDGVDLILHAGDIYAASALDDLERVAPVLAVGEHLDLAIGSPRVEAKRIIEVGGARIGMVHILTLPGMPGEVFPGRIERWHSKDSTVAAGLRQVFGVDVDACVFGDTHFEVLEQHGSVLLMNPGSPTLPHQMMRLGTVGILEVHDGRVDGRLVAISGLPGPEPVYV